jgi:hypothetical protein
MENNQLAVRDDFDVMQKASTALFRSGYFTDVKSEAQAIAKVMAGRELGLPAFASMAGIHIIQGKPALGSNVIATLIDNNPRYDYKIKKHDSKECIIDFYRNGVLHGTSSFTMEEAQTAGLTNNPSWKKFPSDMLFARAITRGARRFAPGIFGGSPIYTPEELGAEVDEDGYIDTKYEVVDQPPTPSNNGHNLVDEAVEMGGVVKSSISLETAENVTNSKGEKYGELDTELLSNMANSIAKAIKKNGMSHEKHEEHQMKLDAIKVILASRNG